MGDGVPPGGESAVYAVAFAVVLVLSVVSPALAADADGEPSIDDGLNGTLTEVDTETNETLDGPSNTSGTATDGGTKATNGTAGNGSDPGTDTSNATGDRAGNASNATEGDAGNASETTENASDNADTGNRTENASETAGNASDKAGNASDTAGNGSDRGENASVAPGNTSDRAKNASSAANGSNPSNAANASNASNAANRSKNASSAARGANNRSGPPQHANVTVRNASAGDPVTMNVSAADTGSVGVETLNLTATRNGSYEVNVTASDTGPDNAPDYNRSDGGVGLGHIRVNHTISDENISSVTFTFELSQERLASANASPEEVALYRYHDGSWNALNTTFLREENGTYVFRAVSPGLSDFTAAAQKPEFELAKALVEPERLTVGEAVDIRVRIHNVGDADGSYTAKLLFDGEVVATKQVTIAADGTRQVAFSRTPEETGTYEVQVNNASAGTLAVEAAATETATTPTEEAAGGTTSVESADVTSKRAPGFGPVAAVVAFVVVLLREV